MPLCLICKSIPFRKIVEGARSLPVTNLQNGGPDGYFVRSHDSIAHLIASGKSCKLCDTVAKSIESSSWYQSITRDEDRCKPVWLHLPIGSWCPMIWIYLGNDAPETRVFGKDVKICIALDDPMAEKVRFRNVQEIPTHDHPLKQIQLWLNGCLSEHSQCAHVAKYEMKLPTRVLDIGTLPSREEMVVNRSWRDLFRDAKCKLVETQAENYGQYVTLSYCWGKTTTYKTTKDNKENHMKGIKFNHLPKTLQDAICITRYLGLQYIWIDCLCIVQDDEMDWQIESASMGSIYSNSWLTIAAARAGDSNIGFLGPRKIRQMDLVSFEDKYGPFKLYFYGQDVSAPGSMESVLLEPLMSEPLSQRVWALQERLLSARTLHFGTDQMYWECAQISECEDGSTFGSGDQDFRLDDIVEGLKSTSPFDSTRRLWYQLIQVYTSRSMTYETDKLPALSGVISAIMGQTNDTYYAGIWKNHFLAGLLWRLENPDLDLYVFAPKQPKRLGFWRAPSWSFAAVEGVIRYELHPSGTDYCAELKQCNLTLSGANPLGELKAGFAQIQGPVTTIEQIGQECTSEGFNCYVRLRDQKLVRGKVFFDFERHEYGGVLMLTPHAGLVITAVDDSQKNYVRIGVVQAWNDHGEPPLSASQYPQPISITLL